MDAMMGIYNFQERFVPMILAGTKTHTIRACRVHPDKRGNTLYLYAGLRHKGARLLMRVPCVNVQEIAIFPNGLVWIDNQFLQSDECESLARRDGFSTFQEMIEFWKAPKNRLPFKGQIIHWIAPAAVPRKR
jgi:hypothetical protein